jgi:nuclear factor erythroid 2, invertebrate
MRMLDQNGTNASGLSGPNSSHLNGTASILNNHLQTNLTAGSSHQHNGDRLDASSDSAVSSMGSERVASLSDGEWNEGGSDSAQEYHS